MEDTSDAAATSSAPLGVVASSSYTAIFDAAASSDTSSVAVVAISFYTFSAVAVSASHPASSSSSFTFTDVDASLNSQVLNDCLSVERKLETSIIN